MPGFVASYSTTTGELIRRYEGTTSTLRAMALSPDGSIVAAGGQIGEFRLWDTATGKTIRQIPSRGGICSLGFSPDGKLVLGGSGVGTIGAWDASTGKLLRSMKGHLDWVEHLAVSPDGKHMATAAAEGVIRLWDPNTGEEVLTFKGHEGRITGLAFSANSKKLLSTAEDGGACVWDTTRDASVITRSVAFPQCGTVLPLPDNRHAVVVNDWSDYQILDFRSGELTAPVRPKNLRQRIRFCGLSGWKDVLVGTYQRGAYLVSLAEPNGEGIAVPNGAGGSRSPFPQMASGSAWVMQMAGSWYTRQRDQVHRSRSARCTKRLCRWPLILAFEPSRDRLLRRDQRVWDHSTGSEELTLELFDHQPVHLAFRRTGKARHRGRGRQHASVGLENREDARQV